MIITIASVRYRLLLNDKIIDHSSYLRDLLSRCKSTGRHYDFTIRYSPKPPLFRRSGRAITLNKITFREISGSVLSFKLDNVCFSVFLDEKTAEIARSDRRAIHDDTIITTMKILASILVLDKGGLALHSSAVNKREKGFLFCGKSGSGKSTLALRLSPGYTILSDEFNIVVPDTAKKGRYRVYATPFTKPDNFRFCTMISCPVLKAYFFIDDARKKQLRTQARKRMLLTLLLENVFTFPTTDSLAGKMFDNAACFIRAVPLDLIDDRDAIVKKF